MQLDLPAADYLPHQPPMLLVQRLLHITPDTVTCQTTLDQTTFAPFATPDGTLPPELLLEIMAQTIGVWAGWQSHAAGHPIQPGLILGCRDFSTTIATLPPGATLTSTARKLFHDDATATFETTVDINHTHTATATLTTRQTTWPQLKTLLSLPPPPPLPPHKPVVKNP